MRLGVYQGEGTYGDIAANLLVIERETKRASEDGVEVLVFPECFLTGYFGPKPTNVAIKLGGSRVKALEVLARDTNVALLIGSTLDEEDKLSNAALFITPEQGHCETYRKRMLYGEWEKDTFTAGEHTCVFNYQGIKIGVLICFDVEFPEVCRTLAHEGVDLILVPTALMVPYDTVATLMVPTRALENQLFVAYANRCGEENSIEYVGKSVIAGPGGECISRASRSKPALLIADIVPAISDAVRKQFCYLNEIAKFDEPKR